jgi:predicted dienelactone hydrolase
MAPAAFALLEPSLSQSTVPALVMGGEYDTSTSMEDQVHPIYQGLAAVPKHLAELATAGHFTFSDACSLLPSYPDCSGEYLDISTAHRLIRGATTAFLEEQAGIAPAPEGWLPVDDPIVTWESVE